MSDDYADSSNDTVVRSVESQESNPGKPRIAVRARTEEEASAFRREFEKQLSRKGKASQSPLVESDADTVLYLLTPEDFADGASTVETIARLSSGAAVRNIMLEPEIADIQTRRRMTETLSDFVRRNGYERLALEKAFDDPAERARHQARAAAKLLLKAPNSLDDTQSAAPGDGRARKKAERRAAKVSQGGKREKKNKKKNEADGDASAALAPEARAAKRAARKAEKKKSEEKGGKKRKRHKDADSEGAISAEDRQARRAAKNAEGKRARRKDKDSEERARAISISITGLGDSAAGLRQALTQKLTAMGLELGDSERKNDVAIYGFDGLNAEEIAQRQQSLGDDKAKVRIFLENAGLSSTAEQNHAIAQLAAASDGSLLRLEGKLARYDGASPNLEDLVAGSILGILAAELSKQAIARPAPVAPPDLAQARTLAKSPSELLGQLTWDEPIAPNLLWTHASKEAMEALIDEKLTFSSGDALDLRTPISWPEEIPDRSASMQILGLEFLTGPLSYWYSKASGHGAKSLFEIDTLLKEREVKASEILARAERVMMDFAAHYVATTASDAWQEKAVSRRVRVLILYVLCCRMALKRHIRFDENAFAGIFRNLLDLIELLRADDFYRPASIDGFEQDCLLVGLGLALRGTVYGNRLLDESLERLRTLQLDAGFTVDGVWRAGSFSDHCSLLSTFKTLMGDFGKSDAALMEPFAAAAKKMTVFAEAILKSNGQPPAFDDSKQKSFASKLTGTRRALAQAGGKSVAKSKLAAMPRMADTYVFRDAQYFVSHSTQKVSTDSSLVLLHADGPNFVEGDPGGVTLAFAYGEIDLIRRAEAPELEKKKDRSPLFDPALRNGYHVDGTGFDSEAKIEANAARLVKSWRGPGWAAARSVDEINPAAIVTRVVVHLKAVHALLVVDSLETRSGSEAAFEQFWHIAPGLASRPGTKGTLRFATTNGGINVAFDAEDDTSVEAEGEGLRVSRARRLARGHMATLFQWTGAAEPAAVSIMREEGSGWALTASGAGCDVRLVHSGDELRYEQSKRG